MCTIPPAPASCAPAGGERDIESLRQRRPPRRLVPRLAPGHANAQDRASAGAPGRHTEGMSADATVRMLLTGGEAPVGEFVCPPADARWRRENDIGDGFHVVFPWIPVHIARRAMPALVATPNHAVLYPPGLRFHRRHLTSEGDHCLFVVLGPGMCEQFGLDTNPPGDPALAPAVWLAQRLLAAYLCRPGHDADLAQRLV